MPLVLFAASLVKADITAPEGWSKKPSADGHVLFIPDDLAAGQTYSIVFFEVEDKGSQSLADWAKQRIEADKTVSASSVSPIQEQQSNSQTPSFSRIFTTANGPLVGIYTAFTTGGNRVCLTRILSSPDKDLIAQHKTGTGKILADQVRALRSTAPAPSTVATKPHTDAKAPARPPAPQQTRFQWTTAPGKGVQPDKIAGIIHAGRGVYQITGYQFVEETYVLLRDGTAYTGLVCPPSDLNVTTSRQHEPDKWLRWKQEGKTLLIQQRGRSDWSKLEGFYVLPGNRARRFPALTPRLRQSILVGVSAPSNGASRSYRGIVSLPIAAVYPLRRPG